jgi:hypothetical protein
MDRAAALKALERVVAPAGAIVTCAPKTVKTAGSPWVGPYDEVRNAWSEDPGRRRYDIDPKGWFAGSPFGVADEITLPYSHRVTIADLIGRALSKSNTSPQVLGERRAAFESALAKVLQPYAVDGFLNEEVVAVAAVLRRLRH